ncbi:MAG: conjugal transfer protein TraE [Lachnospiraceae bacterium]|nr:conjugal transfer protein TraE [Lachnospiraceae bacterium]
MTEQEKIEKQKNKSMLDPVVKVFTGLDLYDYKRLKSLKKDLSHEGKIEKPTTAQQTIRFDKMYQDGICLAVIPKESGGGAKVGKTEYENFYTKMIEFYDVNYELLDIEDQAGMLGQYSNFINYFTPGTKGQLFLFNRKVPEEVLMKAFEIPAQNDNHDDIRDEFSGMLKKQNAKGNNGIIKSKYFIFGLAAKNVEEARSKLNNLERDIEKNLRNMGTNVRSLDGKERLLVLHDFFNQGTMSPFRFSFKDMAESGHNVKDYIAPPAFDFRFPSRFKIGRMLGSAFYMDITAPRLSDELLKNILNIDANISISIHFETKDPVKAMKQLKGALSNIQKSKIDEQKKAVRGGYDMDIIPSDILTYEQDTLKLLEDLNTSNQKMVDVTFIITCFASNRKELDNLVQRVNGIIQQGNCDVVNLQYQQEQGLNSTAPIGINLIGSLRELPTKCVATMIPFQTQELFMGGQSLYYGTNTLSNNMIMADRKKLRTPNGIILGTPGSGKSFSAKREMLMCFLITHDDILICDPEGEYYPLVKVLGGQVIKLATNSKDYLNPMDIHVTKGMKKEDFEELRRVKSDFIITLCDTIAGEQNGLNNLEKGIIDSCLDELYSAFFADPIPEKMPILEDLQAKLLKYEPKDISEEMAVDAKRAAVRISQSLELYVHGSQNFFNNRTTVDSQNRIICFDIRDLSAQLKELGMLIVQDAVWNRVSENRNRRIATRYYCDEFHLLLREPQTAKYMVEIWKRFRKWGGIPTALTQNVTDFFLSPQIEGIIGNSDFVYLLNQASKDQDVLADKLNLSYEQLKYVTNAESGCGLILFDRVCIPFTDHFPTETKCYKVMTTKPEEVE